MYGVLPLLVALVVPFLFQFQVSDCSRPPSPEEPWTIPRPVFLRDDKPHVQQHHRDDAGAIDSSSTTRPPAPGLEMEARAVGKKAARADDDGGAATSATTAPARDVVDHQVGSGSTNLGGALMTRTTVRLRSELPRRVLAGAPPVVEGAADSAAKSSCHSSDVHISCPPSRN
jgi:hypothetical protein